MDCERARELIMEFLYDELPSESVAKLQEHLAECKDCSKYKEEIQQTIERLDQADDVRAPVDLEALHYAIDGSRHRWRNFLRHRWPAWAAAVGACGILLFVFTLFASEVRYEDNALTIRFGEQETDSIAERTALILAEYRKDQLEFQKNLSNELRSSVVALTKMINSYETRRDEQFAGVFDQMQIQQHQMLLAIQKELEILASQTEDEFERSYLTMAAMAELASNP